MQKITLGVENLLKSARLLKGNRIGLLCHPASVNHDLIHTVDLFVKHPDINLTALFGPQHGIRGETQDNMIEWESFRDKRTDVTAWSLYGAVREPTNEMLNDIDVLIADIQDVGTRVYTFIYTVALAMKACARMKKRMIVLDRPNPVNGESIEGNILEAGHESFVGMYPIPMRHGLTIAEAAWFFNSEFGIGCDLEVIPMNGYKREFWMNDTDAPWIMPSPNIPTLDSATVYPGTVLIEGTLISEGRGTTRPFELIGAPYADSQEVTTHLNKIGLPGVIFRPHSFQPTFQKYSGVICHGVQIHVTDRDVFKPVITGIAIIKAFHDLYQGAFEWQSPPYEYEHDRLPFDVIAGSTNLRKQIESGDSLDSIADSWVDGEEEFTELRSPYLLY